MIRLGLTAVRFTATSDIVAAQRPAGKASPSPIKEIATARRHSRPWLMEFVCTMSNIPPPDRPQGRAGNGITCANCDSRRMRFCCDACRQSAFRTKKWASRYEGLEPLRSVRNTPESTDWNGNFGDRASRICGPMRIIKRELFDGLLWRPVVSPHDVRVEIARLGAAPTDAIAPARIKKG